MTLSKRERHRVRRAPIGEFEQLAWIGGRQPMLGRAGLDLNRPPAAAGEQQTLTLERAQQEPALARCEAKARVSNVDDFLGLLQQQLHLRVRQNRLAVLRSDKIADLL